MNIICIDFAQFQDAYREIFQDFLDTRDERPPQFAAPGIPSPTSKKNKSRNKIKIIVTAVTAQGDQDLLIRCKRATLASPRLSIEPHFKLALL